MQNIVSCFLTQFKYAGAFLTIWVLGLANFLPAQAQTPTPQVPPGFYQIDSALGVQLYKKDYPKGNPDYVQVIDLSQGARLQLLYGEITEARPEKGVYGGADPRLTSLPMQTYWQQTQASEKSAFCVTNGQFFYMPEYPTRLAFPLKVDGRVITDGWGIQTYLDQKLMLELWENHADIVELNQQALQSSTASNLIGGLTETANKRAKYSVGRTFVGIADRDNDGEHETVLVFNSISALQSGAADALRGFGADKVMMLDGGGSTQLLCKSGWHIRSDRPVPQALAVIAANPPPISSQLISHSKWSVVMEGEAIEVQLQVKNTGIISWTHTATTFYLHTQRMEFEQRSSPDQAVMPGQTTTFSETLIGFNQSGTFATQIAWGIEYQGKAYPGETIQMSAIVLPYWLRDRKNELKAQVQKWTLEQPTEVEKLAKDWMNRQSGYQTTALEIEGLEKVRPLDAALIPLIMLPVAAIIALVIGRIQR